jgi:hypothetical protein
MVRLKLHQPIEGGAADEVVDVPAERADWLVANGYASLADSDDSTGGEGELVRDVNAENDPTLASNREAPDDEDGNPAVPTTENPSVVWQDDNGAVQDFSGKATRGFDPAEHTVEEVNAYLAEHPQEAGRVLGLERDPNKGKQRKGVLTNGTGGGATAVDDRSDPKPVDEAVVGPATPSADTLAGREPKLPNDPEPGDAATTVTPGDPKADEPEHGTVVRNPATGTAF